MKRNGKQYKKILALGLILALFVTSLTGCKKEEEKKRQESKGRYVEKEISLPNTSEIPAGLMWKDGKLGFVLVTEEGLFQSYTYDGKEWSEGKEETELNKEPLQQADGLMNVFLGRDGNLYRRSGDSPDMEVLRDGTKLLVNIKNSCVECFKDEEMVATIPTVQIATPDQTLVSASDETIAVIGEDGTSVVFYDGKTFEKKHTVAMEQSLEECMLEPGKDGMWYVANHLGIHRITENGSIAETVMEGSNTYLGDTASMYLRGFTVGDSDEFYGLFAGEEGWKLMQYVFDENAPAMAKTELSIYSLMENDTVSRGISAFRKEHPDVEVEYTWAVERFGVVSTDEIRSLNTELLAGSGADILILDGLSYKTYMEKGVLEDVTDVAKELEQEGVLPHVIQNTAQKDGKIYAIPARIHVPLIYGTEEEVKACESLDALQDYAEKNREKKLFGYTEFDQIGMTLFHLFYPELQEEDGSLDEEKLVKLLQTVCQLYENGGLKEYNGYSEKSKFYWLELKSYFMSNQEMTAPSYQEYVHMVETSGFDSVRDIYYSSGNIQAPIESIKNYYVPYTIAGINASSLHKKVAKEFIPYLFKEEIQKKESYEGFTVSEKVLNQMPDYVETSEGKKDIRKYVGLDQNTREEYEVKMGYPSKEETQKLVALIKNLDTPFYQEQIVTEMVLEELERLYRGKQSVEETAREICKKVDLYLAE